MAKGNAAYQQVRLLIFRDLPEHLWMQPAHPAGYPFRLHPLSHGDFTGRTLCSCIPRTYLLLPGNTKNTPTASSSPTSTLRASKLRHDPSKLLQPEHPEAAGHPPITGRVILAPGCRGYPNHGWGNKRVDPGRC